MKDTKIEWCDHSWSPWRGCTKVSPGCANCYAETLSKRNPGVLGQWGKGKPRVLAKNWDEPLKWNRRQGTVNNKLIDDLKDPLPNPTVFPSLCDWLDDEVPVEWLARFLKLMHDTPNVTWLLLTKRPENWANRIGKAVQTLLKASDTLPTAVWAGRWQKHGVKYCPTNVRIGTSVENQEWANKRIPELLKIPARGRFLSVEPMLGPVDFIQWLDDCNGVPREYPFDWVIFGGESGPGARPCDVDWIRSGVSQCKAAGVAVFVKQLGAQPFEESFEHTRKCWNDHCTLAGGPDDCAGDVVREVWTLRHPKGGDPSEWPEDLRVREFPEGLR